MLTIYKASAGSGKTFTLAYEYIKTLLGIRTEDGHYRLNSDRHAPGGHRRPGRHRAILALTFTNAATDEMKRRIVKQISALADAGTFARADYSKRLLDKYGCTPDELRHAAATALSELLYDYANFNVSTIDSFFQGILRTFSREVDQQGDYDLAIDSNDAISQSISLMLDELNYASPKNADRLIDWISNYTLEKVREGKSFNFFQRDGYLIRELANAMEKSMDETFGKYSKPLREYLADPTRINDFDKALRKASEKAFDYCAALGASISKMLAEAGISEDIFGAVHARMALVAEPKAVIKSDAFKPKAFQPGRPDSDLFARGKEKKYGSHPAMGEIVPLVHQFCDEMPRAYRRRKIYDKLRASLGTLDFMGMALHTLEKYLRDSNTVLLSDTGELLKRIISDAEMPFIYERLGMKLETLLIDEFQDTSKVQWHNLKPLVGNSLAQDFDSLIIGDEKQSIYRFRNSDSELLGRQVQTDDFPTQSVVRGNSPEENTNWRSAGIIVRFNNTVFNLLSRVFDAKYYGNVIQTPSARFDKQPGYIKIHFHAQADTPGHEEILESMAREMLRQHEAGYHWSDILVLCRQRKEASEVVKYLTTKHPEIRVLSSEALLLSNSPAVRSVMSMLRLISRSYQSRELTRPGDEAHYASHADIVMMITRYHHYESEGYAPADALEAALQEGAEAAGALKGQIEAIRAENPANLVALVEAVISHKLSAEQRSKEYAYIAALQDLAIKQAESTEPSLAEFIAAYERNKDKWAIKASADLDAVEIMTIHRSKGLEKECVHIPFGDWEIYHENSKLWIPMDGFTEFDAAIKPPLLRLTVEDGSPLRDSTISPVADYLAADRQAEIIDNLNDTYVAYTRAKRELFIHCQTDNIGAAIHTLFTTAHPVTDPRTIDLTEGYDELTDTFTLGGPTTPGEKAKSDSNPVDAGDYPVIYRSDTRELVSIDDALATDLDIGGEEDKETVDTYKPFEGTPEMQEAARRGTNLHAILAAMRTIGDLPRSLAWQCAREDVDDSEADEYRATLTEAITSGGDTVSEWFDPGYKVYAERSIYVPDADESFRPDRVIVRPDGSVVVVDYKFTAETRKSHHRQVSHYVELLHRLGRPSVEGYIWYPVMKKIIKV